MIKIIEVILEKETLEEHKITEVKILEEDIKVTWGMIILEEVEVGLEKDNSQATLGKIYVYMWIKLGIFTKRYSMIVYLM